MLDDLDALLALRQHGSMTRAATALRLSQSAVSKRIAALAAELGAPLVEPAGRGVQLTPFAAALVDRTGPVLAELKQLIQQEHAATRGEVPIAISESVLASWGPALLARVGRELPDVHFLVAAHRSPVAIDRVRSGEAMLALVAGRAECASGLRAHVIGEEPMVVVGGAAPLSRKGLSLLTIEAHSATWQSLEPQLRAHAGLGVQVTCALQSFCALTQMARAGLGPALVPVGVALAMRGGKGAVLAFPAPGLARPISLVARTRTFDGPLVRAVAQALSRHAPALIPAAPSRTL